MRWKSNQDMTLTFPMFIFKKVLLQNYYQRTKVVVLKRSLQFCAFFRSVILFIVEDLTYNICDQKFHEFEIRKQNPDVYVIRKTLTEVADQGRLDDEKRLFIGKDEVAVIYFR